MSRALKNCPLQVELDPDGWSVLLGECVVSILGGDLGLAHARIADEDNLELFLDDLLLGV